MRNLDTPDKTDDEIPVKFKDQFGSEVIAEFIILKLL